MLVKTKTSQYNSHDAHATSAIPSPDLNAVVCSFVQHHSDDQNAGNVCHVHTFQTAIVLQLLLL